MNIPVTEWTWLMAALPIVVLLVLMVKFQWSAAQAPSLGLCISLVTAATVFKADLLLIAPVKSFLGQFKLGFAFPEMSTGYGYVNPAVEMFSPLSPLTHAGMFLFLSAVIGFFFYKKHKWLAPGSGNVLLKKQCFLAWQ